QVAPTEKGSPEALIEQLVTMLGAARGADARAVGVGIPSAVEFATGTAKSGVNVPLRGVPLRNILTERLGLPVFVDNDATVTALDRMAAESARSNPDSPLGRLAAAGEPVAGPAVVREAKAGDPESRRLLRVLGERLGIGIASAINLFDPEEVVIGGGVATAG